MMYIRHMKILGVTLAVLLIAAGCAATRPENFREGSEEALYYDKGYAAGEPLYTSAPPVFEGILTGIVAPVPALLMAKAEMRDPSAGVVAGMGYFATIWGGRKLVDTFATAKLSKHTAGMTELQKQAFERGYLDRVRIYFSVTYGIGFALGTALDMYIAFLYVMSQLGPIGA